jgi:two-component system response regulator YesN
MFRVIIVEDEPPIRRNIRERIKASDPDFKIVGEYSNGEDALLEIDILKPHLVLSDIRMPVMDGITFIKKLKETHPNIQCAILSGFQDFEYARQAIVLGVQEYLLKPATIETIRIFLQNIKKNLAENQQFVEKELLHAWTTSHTSKLIPSVHMENEYFYHPVYLTCCIWNINPFTSQDQTFFSNFFEQLLTAGEKKYSFPNHMANEWICILGIYSLSKSRLQLWQETFFEGFPQFVSCVIVQTAKLKHQLAESLEKARTTVKLIHRIKESTLWIMNDPNENFIETTVVLPEKTQQYLLSFFENNRKQEFLDELATYIHQLEPLNLTRQQWIKTLGLLLNTLSIKSSLTQDQHLFMEREIDNVLWHTASIEDLTANLKQLFAPLFQEVAPEQEGSWIDAMEQYLQNHYTENITLQSLSERYHLNALYLSRAYTLKKNLSPIDYLTKLRMVEAQRLIKEFPRLLFKEIALEVGYTDPYYFSKSFKQWSGLTLTEFKNKHSKGY